MKILDYFILFGLILFLSLGTWILWLNLPAEEVQYSEFDLNLSHTSMVYSNSSQFYPRMRYQDREIKYWIDENCSPKKRNSIFGSLMILMNETVLRFRHTEDKEISEIRYLCSEEVPQKEGKDYYVAGEGGPTEIINTSNYFIIFKGEVVLYRDENCPSPQVALHETLHALGFDHNNNRSSIMYPITNCEQVLDNHIIKEINGLYSQDSLPDVLIESLSANRSGSYLNFDASISNIGLKNANEVFLLILEGDGKKIKEFDLKNIDIGVRRKLNVQNLKLSSDNKKLIFSVGLRNQQEMNEENNIITIVIV